jgi:1-acyl-sn-glycerol-3-phosphate acyltransferase
MMRKLISWSRFVACILLMCYIVGTSYLCYPFIPMSWWRRFFHKPWARAMIWAIGAKFEVTGSIGDDYIQPNTMFVQNHVSWLDTLVMSSVYCTNYVGKVEMLRWALLRNIIKSGGTVFIDRKNKRDLVMANKKIAKVMQDGWAMGLFPEGTTSDGMTILPFHASIFESAMIAKSRVVPVVLRYRNADGSPSTEVAFSKKRWMESVWSTLRLKGLVIKIDILEAVNATDFTNREALSQYMYEKISTLYHSDLDSKPAEY